MAAKIIDDPLAANVSPAQLFAWVRQSMEDRGKITAREWNEAVHAMAGTDKE